MTEKYEVISVRMFEYIG